jgi:peptidoglycan biosynthesis protein MviN/MurJ (putative lipid II flippase)
MRAFRITIINILSRVAYLGLFLWIGNSYGASTITDSVFFLQAPLIVLMTVIAGAAELIVMPLVHRAEKAGLGHNMAKAFQQKALLVVIPATLGCIMLGAWLSPGYEPVVLLILATMPLLARVSATCMGVLNARGHHSRAVLGPIYGSAGGALVLAFAPLSQEALASTLLGYEVVRLAGLRIHTYGLLAEDNQGVTLPDSLLRWSQRGTYIQMLASTFGAMNPLVDIMFANRLADGSITQIEYAGRLWNLVPLLVSGQITLLHARFSQDSSASNLVRSTVDRAARKLALTGILISAAAIVATPALIDVFFGLGNLTSASREILSTLLITYLFGAAPFLIGIIYVKALSAAGNLRDIAVIAACSVLINACLNASVIPPFGI